MKNKSNKKEKKVNMQKALEDTLNYLKVKLVPGASLENVKELVEDFIKAYIPVSAGAPIAGPIISSIEAERISQTQIKLLEEISEKVDISVELLRPLLEKMLTYCESKDKYDSEYNPYVIAPSDMLEKIKDALEYNPETIKQYLQRKEIEEITPGKNCKILIEGRPGAGKTTGMVKLLEKSNFEKVLLIKVSFRDTHIDRLLQEDLGENFVLVWDDIQDKPEVFLNTILRLQDKYRDFAVICAARSTEPDKLNKISRRIWEKGDFKKISLEAPDREWLLEFIGICCTEFHVGMKDEDKKKLADKTLRSDPTPFYIVSVISPRKGKKITGGDIEKLPENALKIWKGYFEDLSQQEKDLLFTLKLLRMALMPPLMRIVEDMYLRLWHEKEPDYRASMKSLEQKQWLRTVGGLCSSYDLQLESFELPETFSWDKLESYLDETDLENELQLGISTGLALFYLFIGDALGGMGKLEVALNCFDKAISINPEYADVYLFKGLALREMGKLEVALNCFDKAISINPIYAEAYLFKGLALGSMGESIGEFNEAKKACETALSLARKQKNTELEKFIMKALKPLEGYICFNK